MTEQKATEQKMEYFLKIRETGKVYELLVETVEYLPTCYELSFSESSGILVNRADLIILKTEKVVNFSYNDFENLANQTGKIVLRPKNIECNANPVLIFPKKFRDVLIEKKLPFVVKFFRKK